MNVGSNQRCLTSPPSPNSNAWTIGGDGAAPVAAVALRLDEVRGGEVEDIAISCCCFCVK
eukprot:CAMPEP_0197333516 /NCGR_PEP_ID=MMETSP0892-20130614/25587_1 /TAXON_ID=44058 ORGANISM="Aureoumbra lagunensis, Strain CCMP1510" /NCGR_SAMPLE_ID=MMETSP0892 /ASSEMBLY_ACC=CAM_ASM_000538 /LENGTH=59 /DNA_ID=CAMNT_0042833337 /DNA_START=98 /DNA_END=277 /DNA_ORIENTATION=+